MNQTDDNPSPSEQIEVEESASSVTNESDAMFSAVEARVLACLMEKQLTVPDSYPLTLNSLVLACNQKSNREPIMQLTEGEVGHVARDLSDQHLIKIEYRGRTQKLEHKMNRELDLDTKQQSLITVMLLRGPQTLNELRTKTARMAEFANNDEILLTLETLNDRHNPLMVEIPKGPGQREDRYTHLLCGPVEVEAIASAQSSGGGSRVASLEDKLEVLERRIAVLEELMQ